MNLVLLDACMSSRAAKLFRKIYSIGCRDGRQMTMLIHFFRSALIFCFFFHICGAWFCCWNSPSKTYMVFRRCIETL